MGRIDNDNPIRRAAKTPWKTIYEDDDVKITEGGSSKSIHKFGDTEFHVTITEGFSCNKKALVAVNVID